MTYSWEITGLKTRQDTDNSTVVQTYWKKIGTDENGNEGSFSGATPFDADPADDDYIAFADLTEEIVLGWIQSVVVDGYEEHVNAQIQKQIDQKINVVEDATLPWATPAE